MPPPRSPSDRIRDAIIAEAVGDAVHGPGTRYNVLNNSKGCGTVMRIAPVGMVFRDADDATVFHLGADVSAITHSHPTGFLSGGVMALITKYLVNGSTLADAINAAIAILYYEAEDDAHETMQAIVTGYEAGTTRPLSIDMLDSLGGGWVAEEALSIAIAATASCNGSTTDALAMCAAINGDSESVASMAGTLCGALYGVTDHEEQLFAGMKEREGVERIVMTITD